MTTPLEGPTGQPSTRTVIGVLVTVATIAALAGIYFFGIRSSHGAPSAPAGQTITYQVSGSDATVTYGPAGSTLSGSAPMSETGQLGDAPWYYVQAQLQGDGSVSCAISVDGQVVSQGTATSAYGVAQCEIVRTASGWASVTGG